MSKRNYKATMVLDPRGNEGGSDEFISQMSDVIRSVEGEVKKVENLGPQDFARKSSSNLSNGVYFQFDIEADPDLPSRLLEKLSLEKKVDRIVVERI
jgi:small subunit ribosomal protein S6